MCFSRLPRNDQGGFGRVAYSLLLFVNDRLLVRDFLGSKNCLVIFGDGESEPAVGGGLFDGAGFHAVTPKCLADIAGSGADSPMTMTLMLFSLTEGAPVFSSIVPAI